MVLVTSDVQFNKDTTPAGASDVVEIDGKIDAEKYVRIKSDLKLKKSCIGMAILIPGFNKPYRKSLASSGKRNLEKK